MKKEKFIEKHANLHSENNLLKVIILILTFAIVTEGVLIVYLRVKERTIIVPTYIDRKFYVEGDKASPEYLEMMAKYAIELVSNYTPETAKSRFDEFMRFISPSNYNTVSTSLLGTLNDITTYQISQYFIPQSNMTVQDNTITATGLLRKYTQDKLVSANMAVYKIQFSIDNGRFVINTYEKKDQ